MKPIDPIALTQALIRCPSVTPLEAGVLDLLEKELTVAGFTCLRQIFVEEGTPPVENLYARWGAAAPNFCFAGHVDVVPAGEEAAWKHPPFAAEIHDGKLYGRGAADMKSSIAAFVAAAAEYIGAQGVNPKGSISFLITCDEEGPAINGTVKMLRWLKARGEQLDACLVGEPTNLERLGDTVKIGRRGSLNAVLTVQGKQGHVAYPHLAQNPVTGLLAIIDRLMETPLDAGNAHFMPSNLEVTSIDVGNKAHNVIPANATARFNIRFNSEQSGAKLKNWVEECCKTSGYAYDLHCHIMGESFLTPPGRLSRLVHDAVHDIVGDVPEMSTTGGTSDARFIKDYCPVVEFGGVGASSHMVDEHMRTAEIVLLAEIYRRVLDRFFAEP